MEPFHHLLPSATTRDTPSPYSRPRRSDLQSVTSEWLSLTLDPSTPTPTHSLTPTPVPPTPPPLPSDFTPFLKAPSPSSPHRNLTQAVSRTPLFQQGRQSLGQFSQISAPLPYLLRSSPSADSSFRQRAKGLAQTRHISKPKLMICTEVGPVKSPPAPRPQHSLNQQAESRTSARDPLVTDPSDELSAAILNGRSGNDQAGVVEPCQSVSDPNPEQPPRPTAGAVRSHQPARAEPLSRFTAAQSERLVESRRAPAVERSSYTELFIEEEEDVLGCRERAPPQADVSPSATSRRPPQDPPSPSTPPPLTSLPPSVCCTPSLPCPPSSFSSRSQQPDHGAIPLSPPSSPRPPPLPVLMTWPLPPSSPPPPLSPPPFLPPLDTESQKDQSTSPPTLPPPRPWSPRVKVKLCCQADLIFFPL
ncbi:uncharacterized protein LOC130527048 [Takifugu flavidus]|uniref:uncharacterized protein LOC130527048 n=1 Tax=Takifugu flavidus TaxID=433684 RepID=UPI0025443F72|nr:uncharacterized protein LOC130527048 [Takifugu flavidus]